MSTPSTTGLYAGVDVSKGRLDVATRPTGERFSVANDPEGIEGLVCRLLARLGVVQDRCLDHSSIRSRNLS